MMWNFQKTLPGAATSKMIKAQKIINEMQLTNIPGLDVGIFHKMVKPVLYVCCEQGNFHLMLVLQSSKIVSAPSTLHEMLL